MFQVKFEYREDEEFGGEGWIPSAYPHFNAASGFSLVHDVLEHFPEDDGDLAGELKAFGSMINVRYLGGWQPIRGYNYHTPAQNMGSELGQFLQELGYCSKELKSPPHTYKVEEYAECMIQDTLVEAKLSYFANLDSEKEPIDRGDIDKLLQEMASWMRIGYRQSVKRYYNACNCELSHLFTRMERAVSKIGGDFGQELTVSVHPRRLEFSVDVRYPYEEEYYAQV